MMSMTIDAGYKYTILAYLVRTPGWDKDSFTRELINYPMTNAAASKSLGNEFRTSVIQSRDDGLA